MSVEFLSFPDVLTRAGRGRAFNYLLATSSEDSAQACRNARACALLRHMCPRNRSATIKNFLIDLHRTRGAFRNSEHFDPFSVGIGQRRNCAVSQLWSVDIVQLLVPHGRGGLFRG